MATQSSIRKPTSNFVWQPVPIWRVLTWGRSQLTWEIPTKCLSKTRLCSLMVRQVQALKIVTVRVIMVMWVLTYLQINNLRLMVGLMVMGITMMTYLLKDCSKSLVRNGRMKWKGSSNLDWMVSREERNQGMIVWSNLVMLKLKVTLCFSFTEMLWKFWTITIFKRQWNKSPSSTSGSTT